MAYAWRSTWGFATSGVIWRRKIRVAMTSGLQVRSTGMRASRGNTYFRLRSLYNQARTMVLHIDRHDHLLVWELIIERRGPIRVQCKYKTIFFLWFITQNRWSWQCRGIKEWRQGSVNGRASELADYALFLNLLPWEAGKAGVIRRTADEYGDAHAEQSTRWYISLLRCADVNRVSRRSKDPLKLSTPCASDSWGIRRVTLHTWCIWAFCVCTAE